MTRRFTAVVSWLAAGHLAVLGLCWLLLQVPESNAWMLALSAMLAVAIVLVFGLVQLAGLRMFLAAEPIRRAVVVSAGRAWIVVLPLAVFVLCWWLTGTADAWLGARAGEIDAWFIARLGWTGSGWVHTTLHVILAFIRYGIGTAAGVSMLAAVSASGLKGLAVESWVRATFGWRFVLLVAGALIAGVALPSHAVYWLPDSLPPTWVQPAFAGLKLLVLFLVANAAWAFILLNAPRRPASS